MRDEYNGQSLGFTRLGMADPDVAEAGNATTMTNQTANGNMTGGTNSTS